MFINNSSLFISTYITNCWHQIKSAARPGVRIEVELQKPVGNYTIKSFMRGMTNAYYVVNVVVRVVGRMLSVFHLTHDVTVCRERPEIA